MPIRLFENKDAQQVSDLIRETLVKVNSKDYSEKTIQFMVNYFTPEKILSNSKKKQVFVFEENNQILGTCSIIKNQIYTVFVDNKTIGKGIGKTMMFYLENIAKSNGFDFTELPSSLTSIGFYKKLGYVEISEVEDENFGKTVIMRKKIK